MPVLVNGTPAEAIYDPELPQSTICDTFSGAYSRTPDGSCYPELTMIADCGFSFAFRLRLVVGHALPSAQLLLGSDWRLLIPPLAVRPISMTFSNTSVDLVSPSSIAPPIAPPPQTGTSLVSPSYSSPPSLSPGPAVHYDLPTLLLPSAIHPHIPPVFSTSVSEIHALLYDHNIKFSLVSSIETCRDLAVHHLVHGACALQPQSPPACQATRRSHQVPLEISNTVVDLCVNSKMCIDHLERVVRALQFTDAVVSSTQTAARRKHATRVLQQYLKYLSTRPLNVPRNPDEILDSIDRESFKKRHLQEVASMHGIRFVYQTSTDKLRGEIADHICRGECVLGNGNTGCEHVVAVYHSGTGIPVQDDIRVSIFGAVTKAGSVHPIRRVLSANKIPYKSSETLQELRKKIGKHSTMLREANRARGGRCVYTSTQVMQQVSSAKEQWPQLIQEHSKDQLVARFRQMTSTASLKTFTCTSCAADHLMESQCEHVLPSEDSVFTKLMQHPGFKPDDPVFPHPLPEPLARTVSYAFLHPSGLRVRGTEITLTLCADCANHLKRRKLPPLALANQTYLGEVPDELKDLTVVEEAMISRSRAKCWIIKLKETNHKLDVPNTQRGMKGHVIVFPQRPSEIARVLPPPIVDVITPICVIFIGSKPPSKEWLREKAKPLLVRKEKVQNALVWLKAHNPLYRNIKINHDLLGQLDAEHLLPFNIQHILPSTESDTATSRYDAAEVEAQEKSASPPDIPFQNVVVTDVDARAPIHELRAAAIRHFKRRGGGYVQIPHDAEPVNEFFDPDLLPMIYPTLFPYGIGGLENKGRKAALSFKRHVRYLLNLHDSRFQEHYSFPFIVFNILQRRAILLHTSLKVKRSNFKKIAASFATVSPEVLQSVSEQIGKGTYSFHTPEERQALDLMKEVKLITANVPASSSSKLVMRNEIKALIIDEGLPSFYLTINPADIYNPIVRLLAGADIDVDNLLEHQMSNYWDQSTLVAKNPVVAAKFFNTVIKAFISALLGYDSKGKDVEGGILGVISAYYGCVEAQGRGTLHCHMLVWLNGALNPDEIKRRIFQVGDTEFQERLLAFLDDTISTSIPEDPGDSCTVEVPSAFHHPCSVRGVDLEGLPADTARLAKQKDTHHLATQCQRHTHSNTCYKYWRGPPYPKECRFNLDEENTRLVSEFDKETEELSLRCLDGLVNNYNDTILRAVRCNMDIKFIGSGNTAKAVCYYITDYITKSQLKTHVAFAALELASRKLGEYDPNEDDLQTRGKRLLQRCAYSMVSHQELSAQQVVSYLMGFEDHFTSHQYRNLYWTSFERLVDKNDPLGYTTSHSGTEDIADHNLGLDGEFEESELEDEGGSDDGSQISDNIDETQPEERNEDEVGVRVDEKTGDLVLRTSQVNDYLLRGDQLKELSLWDFVAQVDKVAESTRHRVRINRVEDSECDSEDMEWEDTPGTHRTYDMHSTSAAEILLDTHRLRPRSLLKETHPDAQTHFLRVRLPTQCYVPVPIGPAIPRRDSTVPKDIERFSRLMLILFKPWHDPADLRESSLQSWADALSNFLPHCSPANLSRMANMQVLHECKDSRDDHFARRSKEKWKSGFARGMGGEHRHRSGNRDDFADETDEYSAILDHLESIERGADGRLQFARLNAAECITQAENSGMFDHRSHETRQLERTVPSEGLDLIDENHMDDGMEDIWRAAYDDRRAGRVQSQPIEEPTAIDEGAASTPASQPGPVATIVACAPLPRKRSQKSSLPGKIPLLGQGLPSVQQDVNIDDVIHKFTLNSEQGRAFKIIAGQASQLHLVPPLRMFLGGAGGTGKSRVLDALKEFFTNRGERHRLRLASFTGVAASNISGSTLHSALSLVQRKSKAGADKSKRNLIALWEGVDFLFIDEVSMIGCKLLFQISNALVDAKGNTAPFGGINIIFAGDFAQLPPVGQRRLSCKMDKTHCPKSEEDLGGQLLWHSVETVVILTEVVRQSGKINEAFVELLGRLREGRCSNDDYEVLMGRTIQNVCPDWNVWQDAPIIVSNNAAKDALNERAALAFAQRTGRDLHWYYAADTRLRQPIGDSKLRNYLHSLDSGRTGHRQGRVPLVVGMPVMVMQNFDVEGGIVNGTTGILKRVRYRLDDDGLRHAISCVVDSPTITADVLPGLEASCAAVLEDTIDLRFVNPYSGKRCTIKRTQLPISPGFAMTAHKAQGKTFERAIVDLTCCIGTEAPYVMVSRVKSLSGLLVLRAFAKQKIACRQSQETRDEMKRLESFRLKTVVEHGSEEEAEEARTMLQNVQRITRTAARKRRRES